MTEIIQVDSIDEDGFQQALLKIRTVLKRGGMIAFPTDTFYGLGVFPDNPGAVAKIFRAKGRPADNPLLVLIAAKTEMESLTAENSPLAERIIEKFWPGPLTLIFNAADDLPENLTAHTGKIGIRLPGNELTRRLIDGIGAPITATSANRTGSPSPRTAEEVATALGPEVDLIVDGGPTEGGEASTVLDTTTSPPRLLREGAVAREEIEKALGIRLA